MTDKSKTVLIIDDQDMSFIYLESRFEASMRWRVVRAKTKDEALYRLEREGDAIDAVILDPGLPPDTNSPLTVGLPLARAIREKYKRRPILVISNLGIKDDPAGELIAGLLPLGVSAVFARQAGDYDPVALLELVAQGYFILSPGAADELPDVVADRPDPLEEDLWDVVRPLAEGHSYLQIGDELGIDKSTAQDRRDRALDRLVMTGELIVEDRKKATPLMSQWYDDNKFRFRRDKPGKVYRDRHRNRIRNEDETI